MTMQYRVTIDSSGLEYRTQEFRDRYAEQKRSGEIRKTMRATFLKAFDPVAPPGGDDEATKLYAAALEIAFYDDSPARKLASDDRERVLIPLLANRADDFALAVHIFMGWLEGLNSEEIGELLFLGGIYNGINTMTRSLGVYQRTFEAVKGMNPQDPFGEALKTLRKAF
jgi:alkylhydroperoxidase/carboxymuconolactone decarboxylase family protein YurZ